MYDYSLLIFSHSNLSNITQDINENIIPEILKNFDISISIVDENDIRYIKLCNKYLNRFPVYVLLKHNKKKAISFNKHSKSSIISWLNLQLFDK